MRFEKLSVNARATKANRRLEHGVNRAIRSYDRVKGRIGLAGRKARSVMVWI